jgi:hypothetical protein
MSAIVLTVASTSIALARDWGYRDRRRRGGINSKFNPASTAGEEGTRRLMRRARRSSAQSRLPHPGGAVGEETVRDEALSQRREGDRCRLTS